MTARQQLLAALQRCRDDKWSPIEVMTYVQAFIVVGTHSEVESVELIAALEKGVPMLEGMD